MFASGGWNECPLEKGGFAMHPHKWAKIHDVVVHCWPLHFFQLFYKHVIGVMFKGYRHSTLPVEIEVDGVDKLRKALLRKKI